MNNNFNNMDDLFNQLMGNMGGFRSESRRYMINGREVTPEEFAIYRQTGQLPTEGSEPVQQQQGKGMKQDGILAKLGRNLTEEAREGKLDPVIGRNKEIQETADKVLEYSESLQSRAIYVDGEYHQRGSEKVVVSGEFHP